MRILLCCLILSSCCAHAEDLKALYDSAKEQDPTLQSAKASQLATEQGIPQAISSFLPNVAVSASTTGIRSSLSTVGRYNKQSNELTLSQNLVNIPNYMALRAARKNANSAEQTYLEAEINLIIRVAEAYFNTLKAKDDLKTAQGKTKAFARTLEQTQQRFDVGLIAITDVQEARARHDNAIAEELRAKNNLLDQKESLREIVGHPILYVQPLKSTFKPQKPTPENIDFWVNKAIQNNHSLKAAEYTADTALAELRQQQAGHLPTLSLSGSLKRENPTPPSSAYTSTHQIGLTLSLPIFAGGNTTSLVRQARYNHQAAKKDLERVHRETESQARQAYRGVLTQIGQVAAFKQAVVSSESALNATDAAFKAGTRTIVDVLNAQSDLLDARKNYLSARYDFILEHLKLRQATGELSANEINIVNQWIEKS